jgi:membrane fusion protein (multidrug efflux system)
MKHLGSKHLRALSVCAVMGITLSACTPNDEPQSSATNPDVEVGALVLAPVDLPLTTELPGRTSPYLIAEIRPQIGGILQKRLFEEGKEVKEGEILYLIDPAPYQAALAMARASYESASLLNQRYARLTKTQAISQQDYDNARSQFLQAKAAVDIASIDLGYTKISAPIAGRIGRSSVTPGALLTANQSATLATIQQLDPIYVDIPQSSTSLLKLRENLDSGYIKHNQNNQAEVRLLLDNGRSYEHTGKLQFSEVTVNEGTNSVTLRAVFPNPDGKLLPGMFVRAQLQEGIRKQALLVPQRGITRNNAGQAFALLVDQNEQVKTQPVKVERSIGNQWLVSEGLAAGDRVILDGVQKVHPGTKVRVVPAKNTASPETGDVSLAMQSGKR